MKRSAGLVLTTALGLTATAPLAAQPAAQSAAQSAAQGMNEAADPVIGAENAPNSSNAPNAQGDVAITIYNGGLSLVQDVRDLTLPIGVSTTAFPDVSARIRPETLSFAAPGTAILEQNFDYDLLTPTKLMEKHIGRTVTLVRTNPATGAETREQATVLSTAGGVVVRIGDRIEVLRDDGLPVRAIFDRVPDNLRARPTLSVTVDSTRAGSRPVAIRYLTDGLGWSADYVALFDDARGLIDMQGWVTLSNRTGTTFHDAELLLVAGDPADRDDVRRTGRARRVPPPPPPGSATGGSATGLIRPGTQAADREQLGDFHLYPIAGRTTVANAQTKQVSFLDAQGVSARRRYGRTIDWRENDDRPVAVTSAVEFGTSRADGLGDALPAGTVRFYQRDGAGNPQFIGENTIGHTPMGSTLRLRTGDAFDVYVQSEVMSRERIDEGEWQRSARYRVTRDGETIEQGTVERPVEYWRTTMRYTFYNAKPAPAEVELEQTGLSQFWTRDLRVVSETAPGDQVNADTRIYRVTVPAQSEREVTVVYDTRF